jgi:hypothetical protein
MGFLFLFSNISKVLRSAMAVKKSFLYKLQYFFTVVLSSQVGAAMLKFWPPSLRDRK